jgi:hypothetical protein
MRCESVNHDLATRKTPVSRCRRCGKPTCYACEGGDDAPMLCDACWCVVTRAGTIDVPRAWRGARPKGTPLKRELLRREQARRARA